MLDRRVAPAKKIAVRVEATRGGLGGGEVGAAKRTFNKRCAEIAPLPRPALFTG